MSHFVNTPIQLLENLVLTVSDGMRIIKKTSPGGTGLHI